MFFFFSSRRRHTRCALVTGVQTCALPILREDALLTGPLEPTNESYAIAKIAGIKLCESYNREYGRDYRSVMPTNLYGPNDNFHPEIGRASCRERVCQYV